VFSAFFDGRDFFVGGRRVTWDGAAYQTPNLRVEPRAADERCVYWTGAARSDDGSFTNGIWSLARSVADGEGTPFDAGSE
jgi:hypothetical protein